jgi:glyoxylase-like metal-dependent hydrolase (beta-lactamase superfamily II)
MGEDTPYELSFVIVDHVPCVAGNTLNGDKKADGPGKPTRHPLRQEPRARSRTRRRADAGVRRVLCNNPSPFTFKGTVSYIVGRGKVAIIDPGPEDPVHSAALLDAVRGETVTHIFVTHTHRDHSPGVPAIKAATGALVLAEGPHRAARALHVGDGPRLESSNDTDFQARPGACRRRGW